MAIEFSYLNAIRIYLLIPLLLYGTRRISGTIFGLESPIGVYHQWASQANNRPI